MKNKVVNFLTGLNTLLGLILVGFGLRVLLAMREGFDKTTSPGEFAVGNFIGVIGLLSSGLGLLLCLVTGVFFWRKKKKRSQ